MDEVREKLDDAIIVSLEEATRAGKDSKERFEAAERASALYKMRIAEYEAENKAAMDFENSQIERDKNESELELRQREVEAKEKQTLISAITGIISVTATVISTALVLGKEETGIISRNGFDLHKSILRLIGKN